MKEYLSQNHIDYFERDIAKDKPALDELHAMGFQTTPVTVIEGEPIAGFKPSQMDQRLKESVARTGTK